MGCWNEPSSLDAFRLSWISLVITLVAAGVGIGFFVLSDSALMLCFGLENMVDFLSSAVVLWRFYCPEGAVDPVREALLQKREKRASMAISIILALLGFGVIVAAVDDFEEEGDGEDQEWIEEIILIAAIAFLVFLTLTVFKFRYGRRLHSASLIKDGVCSLIGTVLSGSLLINSLIIWEEDDAWFLDPVVATVCGIASLYVGSRAIIVAACFQGIPVFHWQWWLMSQGDGMDEVTGRELTPEDVAIQAMVPSNKDVGPDKSSSSSLPGETELTPVAENGAEATNGSANTKEPVTKDDSTVEDVELI